MPAQFSMGLRNLQPRTRMKTETPRPILLKDYRPPNYLIDHVDLDVSLAPERTRVNARLKMRPNPAFDGEPGALRLDGEMLELEGVRLGGRPLSPQDYTINDRELVIGKPPAGAFVLEIVTFCNPEANKAL